MKLSVVIVNYNVKHFLVQCLDSVHRAIAGMEADVWVIDNASSDDSIDYARRFFPNVHYVENRENVGFARANNQAIRASEGEYVLLLNPDTIVGETTLHTCVDFLDSHPEAGATGACMLNRDGSFARESRRGLPTPLTAFYKMSGLCSLMPKSHRFGKYYMGYLNRDEANQIEVISGAFMMIRRTTLDAIGLLDEDYFMYGEDIDLSYRILQGGWQNWYVPATLLHYKGESTQKTSARYVHNFYNAMLIFFDKHFRQRYRLAALLIRLAVYGRGAIALVYQMLRRCHKLLKSIPQHLNSAKPSENAAERLLFVGTDDAWMNVKSICQKAGLEAQRIEDCTLISDEVAAQALYLAFQTDAECHLYEEGLRCMQTCHKRGMQLNIGTYSTVTHTLILPNDTFS